MIFRVVQWVQSVHPLGNVANNLENIKSDFQSKVSLWLSKYEQDGVDGLLEGHRLGKPARLSEKQLQELSGIIDSGPIAYGFNTGVWTAPMIVRVIDEEFSVIYSSSHVTRILHKLDF